MTTNKKQIVFYGDADVEAWYKSAPHGQRSKVLNGLVRSYLGLAPETEVDGTPNARLTTLELKVEKLIHRLGFATYDL